MTKPQLVGHWRLLWRAWSVRIVVVILALQGAVEALPPDIFHAATQRMPILMAALSIAALIARFVQQSGFPTANPSTTPAAAPAAQENPAMFEDLAAKIAAAETEAERLAAEALAVSKTQIGQEIISAAIAELPAEDQPIANIVKGYGNGSITLVSALTQLYAIHEQAKATVPAGYVPATVVEPVPESVQ